MILLALLVQEGFVDLFDGKSLAGWKQLNGKAAYAVEDGAVVGSTVLKEPNSFLCTEKMYGDFILELEFKVDPKLNSGIQIRSNSLPEYQKGRVHGYQCEIDPSARAYSAGIYDEARRGWLNDLKGNEAAQKAFKQNEWNAVRIECVGDSIKTWLNGVAAADLVDSMTLSGFISLQVHSAKEEGLQVRWRKIRIKELGRHVWKPLFDGKSLAGWKPTVGTWEAKDGAITGASAGTLITDITPPDFTVRAVARVTQGKAALRFRGRQAEFTPAKDAKPGDWIELTVSAHGKRVVVHVNGARVSDVKDDAGPASGAPLALELTGDARAKFKSVELLTRE